MLICGCQQAEGLEVGSCGVVVQYYLRWPRWHFRGTELNKTDASLECYKPACPRTRFVSKMERGSETTCSE